MQRAAAAANAAQARVYAAQTNLSRQLRQAKQKAGSSPAVASAKSEHTQSERDYQTARDNVVENLKRTNPEFSGLLAECSNLRQQIASIAKNGSSTGPDITTLESQLRTKARKVSLIENEAINADSSVKDILARQATSHTAEVAATKQANAQIAQDPGVKAAQKQLAQANQQAMLAANRYANTSSGGYGGRGYGYHRGYGHRRSGYGYPVFVGGYRSGYHVHHAHHVHQHHHVRR